MTANDLGLWVSIAAGVVAITTGAVVFVRWIFAKVRRVKTTENLDRYLPPAIDADAIKARADATTDMTLQLDRLLEEADAVSQRLGGDELDGTRLDRWTTEAEHFVALNFHDFATDFRIARVPKHVRLGGGHTDKIWVPLKRVTAQMEVLQEIKHDLRQKSAQRAAK